MSSRLVAGLVGVLIATSIGGSTATAADDPRPGVSAYTLSAGRLGAIAAALVGLTGVVTGGLAVRSARRRGAAVALVAGLIGTALGGLVVASADGGIGTGNGVGGAIVALVVGLIGTTLGGLALARSRRRGQFSPIPSPHPPAE